MADQSQTEQFVFIGKDFCC